MRFDLRERTYKYAVAVVKFIYKINGDRNAYSILNQLMRSATSIGANIEEADSLPTRKDFKYKMVISKKEAAKTVYWLKIIIDTNLLNNADNIIKAGELLEEGNQILRILGSIVRKI